MDEQLKHLTADQQRRVAEFITEVIIPELQSKVAEFQQRAKSLIESADEMDDYIRRGNESHWE